MKQMMKWCAVLLSLWMVIACAGCAQGQPHRQQTSSGQEEAEPESEPQTPPAVSVRPEHTEQEEAILAMPVLELPLVDAGQMHPAELAVLEPAGEEKPVVFIADGGTGDGTSPDSPLRLENSGNVCITEGSESSRVGYYDSILYQAAAKLYGTGGTIVLVGEVLCDGEDGIGENGSKELRLPHLGGAEITITSVYEGVDYRQTNGARLVLQAPVCLALNNPTTFRDMDICTQAGAGFAASNRTIAGDGFRTVVDSGVRCIPLDENGNAQLEPAADTYPSLLGGHRINSLEGSTDLTVRSGTFYTVTGGCLGVGIAGYGDLQGSSRVTIEGSARILGVLSGASPDSRSLQDGDAILTINGGEICSKVQISGAGGFAGPNCTGTIRINGGSFADSVKLMAKAGSSYFGCKPGNTLLDYSGYTGDSDLKSKAVGFAQIAGLDGDAADIKVDATPSRTQYFSGDMLDLTGLSLSMTYGEKEKPLAYDSRIAGFRFYTQDGAAFSPDQDRLTENTTSVQVYYGQKLAGELELTVVPRPEICIVGSAVKTDAENQSLGFLAGVTSESCPEIEIKTCGIVALPADLLENPADLICGRIAGFQDLPCSTQIPADITATCGTEGLLFAAVENIPVEEYTDAYTAAAYYTFVYDEQVYTAWSLPCTTSVYSVAKQVQGVQNVVSLAENGGVSTRSEELISEKIEAMIEYFESMARLRWICPEEVNFAGSSVVTGALRYYAGKEYQGLPYIGGYNGIDNLENFTNYLDENGVYTGPTAWNSMHGNNCTSAIFQSISRVTNHYDYWAEVGDPVLNIIPKMDTAQAPVYQVGPYEIRHTSAQTPRIVEEQSDIQIVYESYAAAKRGDYLVSHWLSDGAYLLSHLRLITEVHTERSASGAIDPYNSYLLIDEQTSTMDQEAATSWGIDRKFFFVQLASEGYLPTRDAAFQTGYFETPQCVVYDINTPDNMADGLRGQVVSNYDLSEVELEIRNAETGEQVFRSASYCYFNRTCSLTTLDPRNEIAELVGTGLYEYILRVTTANEQRELIRFVF